MAFKLNLKEIVRHVVFAIHQMPYTTYEKPTRQTETSTQSIGESSMTTQYPRVLFVLKYREDTYGSAGLENGNWGDGGEDARRPLSSGLYNSARMVVGMLEHHGVPVKLVHVLDNNYIHREIVKFNADVVIIEAFWVVPEKFDELYQVAPHVKFIIRNHSETPFLANEGIAFDWMLKYVRKPNVFMSANAPRMNEETRFLVGLENEQWTPDMVDLKTPYLPNYYPTRDCPTSASDVGTNDEFINIGCFGAVRPLKNTLEQAIASMKFAKRLGKRLRFHINGGRIEMGGQPILKNLYELFKHFPQYELVNHPWMEHTEFRALIASMDLVTQVSFSETFNIVAADAVTQNVLTITSSEVPWSARILQANPTSSSDIADAMMRGWELRHSNPTFNPSLIGLEHYNKDSEKHWLSYLSDLGSLA
jgi:hypothetical protein